MKSIFKNTVMAFALMFTSLGAFFAGVPSRALDSFPILGHNISDGVGYLVFEDQLTMVWGGVKLMSADGDADLHGLYDWL